ncbi:hypothetical protein FEP07_05192 [Burkholderia multivorans]|nr:hypothetical protein [Burkholderia multivorans]MDR9270622.1 hypothetical protein [Burkholderia multivorans]MDR9287734.1 hypothetical protein [Burkholderia multivorans]MDR9293391.1 hypothetical protein [Burkholderia multivorans]MDR9312813.1 hypothetical protein [Burkholderia multivorans]
MRFADAPSPPAPFAGRRRIVASVARRCFRPGFRQSTSSSYRPTAAIDGATTNSIQPTKRPDTPATGRSVVDRDTVGRRHDAGRHDFSRGARKAARGPSSRKRHRISPTPSSPRAADRRTAPSSFERVRPFGRARVRACAHRPAVRHFVFGSQSLHHLACMEACRASARPSGPRKYLRDRRAPNASRFDHAKSRPHRISTAQPRLAWRSSKGGFKIRSILKSRSDFEIATPPTAPYCASRIMLRAITICWIWVVPS